MYPATGKTTLTARLTKDLGIPAFSKDDFKELIADTIGFTDHESTRYFGKASFVSLFLVAKRCLESGVSVIIEGNFSLGEETKDFISYLKQSNVQVYQILCYADGQLTVDRFMARKRHPVHHTLDDKKLMDYAENTLKKGKDTPLDIGKLLEVDTTDPDLIKYEDILSFIRE